MATPQRLDFCGILTESSKITKSHSRHFLALSVLFLLPLSFSLIAFPTLRDSISDSDAPQAEILLRFSPNKLQQQQPNINILIKPITFTLLYALTLLTLILCSTASITYSVYHGFFGRPVKLGYAIKSLSNSLMRLFATFFCAQVIILGCVVVVGLIAFTVIRGIEHTGLIQFEYTSVYFRVLDVIGLVVLGLGLLWLEVNWGLAPVIVVVESSWGLEPLRRSAYLVKGMRGLVVCLLLYFGGIMGLLVWASWEASLGSGVLRALLFVLQTVLFSAILMLFLLHSLAANTVLYMYCKALHGELAGEIAEEFAREYVSLPFDDEKVPHVVSFIQP